MAGSGRLALSSHRAVNLSSTSLAATTPGMGLFMAAKAAVETLTPQRRRNWLRGGSRSTRSLPGAIASPMFFEGKTEEQIARVRTGAPAGRLGSVN